MNPWPVIATALTSALLLASGPALLSAQVCQDEEVMVGDFTKALADLAETVKKESLADFEKFHHQRSAATKMSLLGGFVEGLLNCLQSHASDPATLKEDADAAKRKIEVYSKLKEKIKQDRDALKAAQTEKEAKTVIEKLSYPK